MSEEKEKKRPFPDRLTSLPPSPTLQEEPVNESDDELAAWRELQSGATTPNLSETMESLKRSLSFSALHEMSTKPSSEVRRNIQNKLWRPKDEEARIPSDWERLIVHVFRAGARAFMISYGLRGCLTYLFALIKLLRTRRGRSDLFKQSFLAEDTVRFALMFGLWSGLFKFVNNALRLLTPFPKRSSSHGSKARSRTEPNLAVPEPSEEEDGLSMSMKSRKHHKSHKHHHHHHHHHHHKSPGKEQHRRHLSTYDPRVRYWHAYVSGAVSSIALLVERKSLVQSFGPQLFVRGLEGSYRFARSHGYIDIPYGSVLVFGIANMQIIWAWLTDPTLLPPSYSRWITKASDLPRNMLDMHVGCTQEDPLGANPWTLVELFGGQLPEPISTSPLKYPDLPPNKYYPKGVSGDMIAKMYRYFDRGDMRHFPACSLSHPYSTNHFRVLLTNLVGRWKWIMPVYLTLYVVPTVFLRPKTFMRDPVNASVRSFSSAARSSAFLAVYIAIVKSCFCVFHEISDSIRYSPRLSKSRTAMRISDMLQDGRMNMIPGFLSCLALFVEQPRRRSELSAYVLPKALESYWALGRRKGVLPRVPYGDFWLASVSISLIMGTYVHHPESLSRLVSLVIYQFLGRN